MRTTLRRKQASVLAITFTRKGKKMKTKVYDCAGESLGGNAQNVNYSEVRQYKNTPAVMAPDLTTGICMGSVTGGGSGAGFGLSFGTTVNDEECQIRRNAIALHQLGHDAAAVTILCQIESIKLAYAQVNAGICKTPKEPK